MARKRATLTDLLNDLSFKLLYEKYKLLARSTFEWDGLPEGIESRYIERLLFYHGKAIFFRDPNMSFMCLRADPSGKVNVNYEPVNWLATAPNYKAHYKADNCVIINNNDLRLPTDPFIMYYVNKLTEADRTMDVNIKAVKSPYIIACDDKDVLTFKQIFKQIDGNIPAIYADKGLNLDSISVLKTDAKFLCNEIMDYQKSVENQLLTLLGYNNLAVDKKERVNVEEATSNDDIINSFAELQLQARLDACEAINKMYGLNVTVKRKEGVKDVGINDVQHNESNSRTQRIS